MVYRERDPVVGNTADHYERVYGLPVVIRVRSQAFKVGLRILPTNGVGGRSARKSESIINVIHRIEFARLVTRADNKCVGTALNQLLGFGEIGDLLALVSLLIPSQACRLNLAVEGIEEHRCEIAVGDLQRVLQSPRHHESMNPG